VDRNIERREALVDDPLELGLREIRERDEVSVNEGEDVVVVLDQELAADALRVLVDETEDAVVVAALRLSRLEFGAERHPVFSGSLDLPLGPVRPEDAHPEELLLRLGGEVDLVVQQHVVDREQALALPEAKLGGQSVRVDAGDGEGVTETDHGDSSENIWNGSKN